MTAPASLYKYVSILILHLLEESGNHERLDVSRQVVLVLQNTPQQTMGFHLLQWNILCSDLL